MDADSAASNQFLALVRLYGEPSGPMLQSCLDSEIDFPEYVETLSLVIGQLLEELRVPEATDVIVREDRKEKYLRAFETAVFRKADHALEGPVQNVVEEIGNVIAYYQLLTHALSEIKQSQNSVPDIFSILLWSAVEKFSERFAAYPLYLVFLRAAESMSERHSFSDGMLICCYDKIGKYFINLRDNGQCLEYFSRQMQLVEKVMAKSQDDPRFRLPLSICCHNLGTIHYTVGNTQEALSYYKEFSRLSLLGVKENTESALLKRYLAISYQKMAEVYACENNYDKQIICLKKSLSLLAKLDLDNPDSHEVKIALGDSNYRIGTYHFSRKNFIIAINFFEKAMGYFYGSDSLHPESDTIELKIVTCHMISGYSHKFMNIISGAEGHFLAIVALLEEKADADMLPVNLLSSLGDAYKELGVIYRETGNESLSIAYFEKAESVIERCL